MGSPPDAGVVHLWLVDASAPWFDAFADSDLASPEDRARARRMTVPRAARDLLARRSFLRALLASYLDRDPRAVTVVTAPGGKPVLLPAGDRRGPTLAFSVGHSGGLYGVAVASALRLGLDLERRRSVPRAEAIAERWFRGDEAASVVSVGGDARDDAFLRLWTGKEALAKRHGAGLRLMMRRDVDELDTWAAARAGLLTYFEPRDGYAVAVASSEPIGAILIAEPGSDEWMP